MKRNIFCFAFVLTDDILSAMIFFAQIGGSTLTKDSIFSQKAFIFDFDGTLVDSMGFWFSEQVRACCGPAEYFAYMKTKYDNEICFKADAGAFLNEVRRRGIPSALPRTHRYPALTAVIRGLASAAAVRFTYRLKISARTSTTRAFIFSAPKGWGFHPANALYLRTIRNLPA